jgi:hypothetical protein
MLETLAISVAGGAGALLIERAFNLPRDIRRHNTRIRNRDADLRTWIEDDNDKLFEAEMATIARARRRGRNRKLVAAERAGLRREVRHRYRDQLCEAKRVVQDVRDSEQLWHGIARWLAHKPIPDLTAPAEKAEVIARWDRTMNEGLASDRRIDELIKSASEAAARN